MWTSHEAQEGEVTESGGTNVLVFFIVVVAVLFLFLCFFPMSLGGG